jgi:hypothetical protein
MNERIKELAKQAGFHVSKAFNGIGWVWCSDDYPIDEELKRFADLIRTDEAQACAKHYLEIMRDAVEQAILKEREACAAVCDDLSKEVVNKNYIAVDQRQFCAKQIRKRGVK